MLLSLAGISSVILGFVISIGLASVLGYPYTLVHAILPFLCLGIGIDDMFVIMQCLNNVKRSRGAAATSVPDLMAETMAHAGVSITVTSVTDVVAFGVGYFTNMPGHVSPHHVSRVTCQSRCRSPVLLHLRQHRAGLHLPAAGDLAAGLARAGREEDPGQQERPAALPAASGITPPPDTS